MDNNFIKLATSDLKLINHMKETIDHQRKVLQKRERLVFAITNNVNYLAEIHKNNKNKMREI